MNTETAKLLNSIGSETSFLSGLDFITDKLFNQSEKYFKYILAIIIIIVILLISTTYLFISNHKQNKKIKKISKINVNMVDTLVNNKLKQFYYMIKPSNKNSQIKELDLAYNSYGNLSWVGEPPHF